MSIEKMFQPHRENADEEIIDFLSGAENYDVVFFDTETNGFPPPRTVPCPSVLSISAVKTTITNKQGFSDAPYSTYNRYYFPRETYNEGAISVNGLNEEVVTGKRSIQNATYSKFFDEDYSDFVEFCHGVSLYVGHNAQDFDTKFIPCIDWKTVKVFDTMHTNTDIVCAKWEYKGHYDNGVWKNTPGWKSPRLIETAKFYELKLEENELHGSMYDTQLTMLVFLQMLKRSTVRLKRF